MSWFKSYWKVDEQEQMVLEARRKTPKRITIIGLPSIVLAGVVFATVFGIVSATHDNSHGANNAAHSVANSVKAVCDVTLYKDSCYSSLGSVVDSRQVRPEELFLLSMKVALSQVSKAIEYFNYQNHAVFKGFKDARTMEALNNCRTCIEGFENAKEALKASVSSPVIVLPSLHGLTRLEAPEWLHSKDRKLFITKDLKKKKADIVVAKDGIGKYRTISDTLKHVPNKSDKRTVIYVKRGIYYESVRVEKTKWNVMMIGDGMTSTIVSGSRNFVDGIPTFSTATFGM
ncbi:putative pectinesterase/pectinesterase inhibitor 24, partial [Mucuna pruriens]